jgi:hypothetical protein
MSGTGIRKMEPLLLFAGEDDPLALDGVPKLSSKLNYNLSRNLLPQCPPEKSLKPLSQPQPDTAIGYLSNNQASTAEPRLETAFTEEEEAMLDDFTPNPCLLFPFLTSQWKPAAGESHLIAHSQSARDGSTLVHYLDRFYQIAYGRPASVLECAHLSVTCDIQVVNIWLHWRENHGGLPTYYMKCVYDCTLRNEKALQDARQILKNHLYYALDERLRSLKAALVLFQKEYPKHKKTKSKGSASVSITSITNLTLPPTPTSNIDNAGPVKKDNKRRRMDAHDGDE